MSETKHSAGPWGINAPRTTPRSRRPIGISTDEKRIASVYVDKSRMFVGEAEANARLIAASPDLLDALVMVRDADDDVKLDGRRGIPSSARAKIDAAIGLAEEGRAE